MLPLALPSGEKFPVADAVGSLKISVRAEKSGQLHCKVLDIFGVEASEIVIWPFPEQVSMPSTMLLYMRSKLPVYVPSKEDDVPVVVVPVVVVPVVWVVDDVVVCVDVVCVVDVVPVVSVVPVVPVVPVSVVYSVHQ